MTFLKILTGILLALFLLGRIRLGGEAEYSAEGFLVKARVGRLWIPVYPVKKKTPRPRKEKKAGKKEEKPAQPQPEGEKKGGSLELVKGCLPIVCEAAGELKRRIRIDKLYLRLTVASHSAAGTAMAYGYANMAIGMLWPMIEQNFEVRDSQLRTALDFTEQRPTVYVDAAFSARLGQLVSFALRFGWKFLRIYFKTRPHTKSQKEAI